MSSLRLWRILSGILALSLIGSLIVLRMHTGYPETWNHVQGGMTISHVRELCGPATYSGGMHPETWETPFLWGRWVLAVGHSEETQGGNALVSTVDVYFDHVFIDSRIVHHSIAPPVKDYDAYYRAFGQERKPTPFELSRDAKSATRP